MTASSKEQGSTGRLPPNAGKGRVKGVPNKTTTLLKDAILLAARQAGEEMNPTAPDGLTTYLRVQAISNPAAFMGMLGKVLPLQITGEDGGTLNITIKNNYLK